MLLYLYINFKRRDMTKVREFNVLLRKIKYDNDAKQKFCCEYYSLLRMHVLSNYGDYSDWEDIVHDVINKLIDTDWTDYPYVKNPIYWLYTIADNHAKDLFKKTNRICEFNETTCCTYSDFDINQVELRSDIRNAMQRLKPDEQYILYSYHWLGKKLYVIAKEMNISYTSARVKIHRARKALEKYL